MFLNIFPRIFSILYIINFAERSCNGREGGRVLRVNEPRKTGARSAWRPQAISNMVARAVYTSKTSFFSTGCFKTFYLTILF
jgi:hypothetical protein